MPTLTDRAADTPSGVSRLMDRVRQRIVWDTDVEGRRDQVVQLQLFGGAGIACALMVPAEMLVHGYTANAAAWLLAACSLALTVLGMGLRPRWRASLAMGYYLLLLIATAYTYLVLHTDLAYVLPTVWGLMAAVSSTESLRRTLTVGVLCSLLVLLMPMGLSQYRGLNVFDISVNALASVACGFLVSVLGGISWRATASALLATGRRHEQLSEQLSRANADLEARVVARTDELTVLSRELMQRTNLLRDSLTEQERLSIQLEDLSSRDELTGLHNRRRFMNELNQASVNGQPFALLLADLDHFKLVNDSLGHLAGDAVLVAVARVLQDVVRTDDAVARIGGEEFAVLLVGVDRRGAVAVANQLCGAIREADLGDRPMTISIGVSLFEPGAGESVSSLLSRADRALYRAKASGRDQVAIEGALAAEGSER